MTDFFHPVYWSDQLRILTSVFSGHGSFYAFCHYFGISLTAQDQAIYHNPAWPHAFAAFFSFLFFVILWASIIRVIVTPLFQLWPYVCVRVSFLRRYHQRSLAFQVSEAIKDRDTYQRWCSRFGIAEPPLNVQENSQRTWKQKKTPLG